MNLVPPVSNLVASTDIPAAISPMNGEKQGEKKYVNYSSHSSSSVSSNSSSDSVSCLSVSHTEVCSAKVNDVWKLWTDLSTWPTWDKGVISAKFKEGHKFEVNGEYELLPQGAPSLVTTRIISVSKNKEFSDVSELDFGRLSFFHSVKRSKGKIEITHTVKFEPKDADSKEIFEKHVWSNIRLGLPGAVKALAKLAAGEGEDEERENEMFDSSQMSEAATKVAKEEKLSKKKGIKRPNEEVAYWVNTVSLEHVKLGIAGGFTQACHGKHAPLAKMKKGDWVIHYSPKMAMDSNKKCQAFTSIGQVTDDAPYQFDMGDGFRPYRRNICYEKEAKQADIVPLLDKLDLTKGKRTNWGMVFRNGFRSLTAKDFNMIMDAMLPKE